MNLERTCVQCGEPFTVPVVERTDIKGVRVSSRRTCSRSCAVALSWKNPVAAATRKRSMAKERQSPKAKARLAAHNERRWSNPENRKKLSEWNRKRWADPKTRKELSDAIADSFSPERCFFYSNLRKKNWADPEYRARMIARNREGHGTPEYRALFSRLLKERWNDPEMRAKYTAANVNRNSPEHREKMRVRMIARWRDDAAFRALCQASMEFYWSQPASREFHSLRLKALWADPIWRMKQLDYLNDAKSGNQAGNIKEHMESATDLMSAVDAVVPRGLPEYTRADIASDITLALLEGELKLSELKSTARQYLTKHRKMFPEKWGPLSLDAPIGDGSGATFIDMLDSETAHF